MSEADVDGIHLYVYSRRLATVLYCIAIERHRQDANFGRDRTLHADLWVRLLAEELGEVARGISKRDVANCREELIQVAALAVAAVEQIDRDKTWPMEVQAT